MQETIRKKNRLMVKIIRRSHNYRKIFTSGQKDYRALPVFVKYWFYEKLKSLTNQLLVLHILYEMQLL